MKRINFFSTLVSLLMLCFFVWTVFSSRKCDFCYSTPAIWLRTLISGIIFFIGAIYWSKEFLKVEKIIYQIEGLPLLQTDEAVEGLPFAGEGIIETDNPIKSPYAKVDCVFYHSIKEIKEGKYWIVKENKASFCPFYLKDDRGKLKINLIFIDKDFSGYELNNLDERTFYQANSEVDGDLVLNKKEGIDYQSKLLGIPIFGIRYRLTEFVLRPGTKVFAFGKVGKKNGELVLKEDKDFPLIISKKSRKQYVEEFYRGENIIYLRHLLATIGFTLIVFASQFFLKINETSFLLILFWGNFLILLSILFTIYNRMTTLKNRALYSLSNIEVELKRRNDLIPRLVALIKKLTHFEKEIQNLVGQIREKILFSKDYIPSGEPSFVFSLKALSEKYPKLVTSENYQKLIRTLIDTEERLAYSREFYNRSVRKYNVLITQFPFNLLALVFGFKQMDFLQI